MQVGVGLVGDREEMGEVEKDCTAVAGNNKLDKHQEESLLLN